MADELAPAIVKPVPGDRSTRARVLLIVAGGIAAYKAPELVRALIAAGCAVQVVLTPAARAFVSELSLATVSTRPVRTSLLDPAEEGRVGHIELADWPDLVLVAPGTADLIARAAAGLADDLAATCLLATRAPVLWAPAMNTNMWRHPATQHNLATLRAREARFVGPDRGELACGWIGEGRMIDPPLIVEAVRELLAARAAAPTRPWAGRRVLISAGPTRTYIDPVRFLSNASTGAMGFALAAAAQALGAEVTLVAGPVELATPAGVRRVDVETAPQMHAALEHALAGPPVDLVAMVAAVSDLDVDVAPDKLDKSALLPAMAGLRWRTGVDILASLTARHVAAAAPDGKRPRFLGFAAQTVPDGVDVEAELLRLGRAKLAAKRVDALFVNRVGVPGLGFASPTNAGYLLLADPAGGEATVVPSGPPVAKERLAAWLLAQLDAPRRAEG